MLTQGRFGRHQELLHLAWYLDHNEAWAHFEGMNHPDGDLTVYTDGHPLLAWWLRILGVGGGASAGDPQCPGSFFPLVPATCLTWTCSSARGAGSPSGSGVSHSAVGVLMPHHGSASAGISPWRTCTCPPRFGCCFAFWNPMPRPGGRRRTRCCRWPCTSPTRTWGSWFPELQRALRRWRGSWSAATHLCENVPAHGAAVAAGAGVPLGVVFQPILAPALTPTLTGQPTRRALEEPQQLVGLVCALHHGPLARQFSDFVAAMDVRWEVRAYVGVAAAVLAAVWVGTQAARRFRNVGGRSNFIPVVGGAAILALFALGWVFKAAPILVEFLSPIKNFRVLGRFAWPGVYVLNVALLAWLGAPPATVNGADWP